MKPVDMLWKSLSEVSDDARNALARLSGLISSQSVVVAQRQAAETERFQQLLTLVGTTVLVPGLVAAAFGANVKFPGKDGVDGFWAMLCFMIASGAGSYALLRSFRQDIWRRVTQRLKLPAGLGLSEDAAVTILFVVALVAAVWGVVVVAWD